MPFLRTWLEELITEWLNIEGFLVQANMPVKATHRGGRHEADVLGARIKSNTLEIYHVETDMAAGGENTVRSILKKFSDDIMRNVTDYFRHRFSFSGDNVNYVKMYVGAYPSKLILRKLNEQGVKAETALEFLKNRVIPAIHSWKENPPHHPLHKGKTVTMPDSYWMLQMIDYFLLRHILILYESDKEKPRKI